VRSKAAAEWLLELGYSSILEIEGGWLLWAANPKLPTSLNTV
jgi:rhodanese-related sulfurtransferase